MAVRVEEERAVIELAGQLTATSGDLLLGVVEGKLEGDVRDLVIDVVAVTDCDVGGAQALGHVRARAARAGTSLTVRGLPERTTVARPLMWVDGLLTRPDLDR